MEVNMNPAGYYVAAVSHAGQTKCRISLNMMFDNVEDAERALAIKARLWIAEFLERERAGPDRK